MTENADFLAKLDDGAKLGWKAASELLKPFGPVAANFAEATRILVASYASGTTQVPYATKNHITRLIRNDTVKATYYFFSKQFKPELFTKNSPVMETHFFDAYTAIDHAAILTFCYLYKTLSKKIEKDEWAYVQVPIHEALAIGGRVGQTVQDVGLGIGLLTRGMRYLSFAAFMRENRKGFKEYRQHLKATDIAFDPDFEQRMWQCSSTQIAGLLLERMGYPRIAGLQFVAAADRNQSRSSSTEPDDKFGIPFRIAECLIDAYMEGHEIPTSTPQWAGKKVELPAQVRGTLLAALNKVIGDKDRIEWLGKGSADIGASSTPELFTAASATPSSSDSPADPPQAS
jgi:hypothetical protein